MVFFVIFLYLLVGFLIRIGELKIDRVLFCGLLSPLRRELWYQGTIYYALYLLTDLV